MYETPYTAVREDGKFIQEFEYIEDVKSFVLKNDRRPKYPWHWRFFDNRGVDIPEGFIRNL